MPRYILSPQAKEDIQKIKAYTQEQWGNSQTQRYISNIRDKMKWLSENPLIGIKRDDVKNTYRSFPVESHIIFYRMVKNHIEIIGVIHQKMDVQKHL